jgi:peptidoglycan/LPS O-acetylase OafA/YrhL
MWLAFPAACWSFGLSLLWVHSTRDFPGSALRSLAGLTLLLATLLLLSRQDREPFAESLAGLSCLLLVLAPSCKTVKSSCSRVRENSDDGTSRPELLAAQLQQTALNSPRLSLPQLGHPVSNPVVLLSRLAPLAYGVYLAHLLFIKVGESLADRLQLPICPVADITLFLVAAIGSTCLAWGFARCRSTRWLLG